MATTPADFQSVLAGGWSLTCGLIAYFQHFQAFSGRQLLAVETAWRTAALSAAAAAAESLPMTQRLDDNLVVPLTSAFGAWMLL